MGGIVVVLNVLILHELYSSGNRAICDEGQFVESASAFCYLCAAILTFFRSFCRKGLERKLTWLFSLTCLLCFIRELDLEYLNIPGVLITLGSGIGRNVLFVTLYLVVILSIVSSAGIRRKLDIRIILKSQVVVVAVVGGVLLVLGSIFERFELTVAEEILEMNGSLLFLLAAILHERIPLSSPEEVATDAAYRST